MIPSRLQQLAGTPQFWLDYFWLAARDWQDAADDYRALEGTALHVELGAGINLSLEFRYLLYEMVLVLEHPELEGSAEIAWDEEEGGQPQVFRWSELEYLCRAIELKHPSLVHPGLPLLLLCRFAPICDDADAHLAMELMTSAWKRVCPGVSRGRVQAFTARIDLRNAALKWRHHADRWTVEQSEEAAYGDVYDFYSLRSDDNDAFPFAALESTFNRARELTLNAAATPALLVQDDVQAMLSALENSNQLAELPILADALELGGYSHARILEALRRPAERARHGWLLELVTGTEPGRWIRRLSAQPPAAGERGGIEVELSSDVATTRAPPNSMHFYARFIDANLEALELGFVQAETHEDALVDLDLPAAQQRLVIGARHPERALEVVASTLLWLRAPRQTRVHFQQDNYQLTALQPGARVTPPMADALRTAASGARLVSRSLHSATPRQSRPIPDPGPASSRSTRGTQRKLAAHAPGRRACQGRVQRPPCHPWAVWSQPSG